MTDLRRSMSSFLSPVHSPDGLSRMAFSPGDRTPSSPRQIHLVPILPLCGQIPRISPSTLSDILSGAYDDHFDHVSIIDCRYGYEYRGGHICNAINASTSDVLIDRFFKSPIANALIIFHCEFSHNRGPQLAGLFRELDRDVNRLKYPNLYYPNVYILDGGYRQFYAEYRQLCDGGYVRMLDESYRINGDLTKETFLFRQNVEEMERWTRKPLAEISQPAKREVLKSPITSAMSATSPITSKALNFLSSPITPPRI
jgi:M-phase inducer tyrosine phosphatase